MHCKLVKDTGAKVSYPKGCHIVAKSQPETFTQDN